MLETGCGVIIAGPWRCSDWSTSGGGGAGCASTSCLAGVLAFVVVFVAQSSLVHEPGTFSLVVVEIEADTTALVSAVLVQFADAVSSTAGLLTLVSRLEVVLVASTSSVVELGTLAFRLLIVVAVGGAALAFVLLRDAVSADGDSHGGHNGQEQQRCTHGD